MTNSQVREFRDWLEREFKREECKTAFVPNAKRDALRSVLRKFDELVTEDDFEGALGASYITGMDAEET